MKHKATFVLAIAFAASAVPASAQTKGSDAGTVAVDGRVAPVCVLGAPSRPTVDLGLLAATSGSRAGRIAVLPDQPVTFPGSFCNFAGTAIRIDATALTAVDSSTPQPGYSRAINYTATANGWTSDTSGATTAALSDGTSPSTIGTGTTQPLPNIANIGVTLSGFTVPGDLLLVAGTYNGIVTVTLGPAANAN